MLTQNDVVCLYMDRALRPDSEFVRKVDLNGELIRT
jgi:hypothetical protein